MFIVVQHLTFCTLINITCFSTSVSERLDNEHLRLHTFYVGYMLMILCAKGTMCHIIERLMLINFSAAKAKLGGEVLCMFIFLKLWVVLCSTHLILPSYSEKHL